MPSLSGGYRDGTSESAKRHERIRRAEMERMAARKEAGAAGAVYAALADFGRLVEFHFTPGPVPADFARFGRTSCGGSYVIVPAGQAFAPLDWLEERGYRVDVSPHVRRAVWGDQPGDQP